MAHPATSFATEVYLLVRRHLDNFATGGGAIPENIAAQLSAKGTSPYRACTTSSEAPIFIAGSVSNS